MTNCTDCGRLLCLMAILLTACGDPLVAPELIQGNRVLGARSEADAAPSLASVAPEQSATVRWLVVSPSGPPALGWAFSLCVAAPVVRDLPICAAPSFSQVTTADPSSGEPSVHFTMPDEQSLAGAAEITVNGAFCASGTPVLGAVDHDPSDAHCPDPGERPLLATTGISVQRDGEANINPSLVSAQLEFDSALWALLGDPSVPDSGCADPVNGIPVVKAATATHELGVSLSGDLREPLSTVSSHSANIETLQLSHYVTAGDLERVYSTIDFEQSPPRATLHWTAPSVVAAEGQLVRFYFILRDDRGGVDWTTRAVCVVP